MVTNFAIGTLARSMAWASARLQSSVPGEADVTSRQKSHQHVRRRRCSNGHVAANGRGASVCLSENRAWFLPRRRRCNSLDQYTSLTISTRNVAMNTVEARTTRDENMNRIPELAQEVNESADGLTYTFGKA